MNTVLFDLDGTLLPMDQDHYIAAYLKMLGERFAADYDPVALREAILRGTGAMIQNDGGRTNETCFWQVFSAALGEGVLGRKADFDDFYRERYNDLRSEAGFTPLAAETVRALKEKGYTLILASNPLYPEIATRARMRWAGLREEDFLLVTAYEKFSYCKPNVSYYREILAMCGLKPQDCLMVGNDAEEDLCAAEIGLDVWLLTDCLINRQNRDISSHRHSTLAEFRAEVNSWRKVTDM
ncbi:MAG: HAD family hydrolase [Gracilibacteraceae bacterium]|jgi:FMN phosphatase YigB (HAD superfamily)|nr:HAD family hydrolase [Gracilibacteraceae bacterium]